MKTKYPNLYDFFSGYFHQDCFEGSSTVTALVANYLNDFKKNDIEKTSTELQEILSEKNSDDDLEKIIDQLGNYYNPRADGLTYREWLLQTYKLLENHIFKINNNI